MPSDPKSLSFQQRKARLRESFLSQLPERLNSAREQIAQLATGNDPQQALKALHLLFHSLKGSSASFGLQSLSTLARQAEQAVRTELEGGGETFDTLLAELDAVTGALEQQAREAAGSAGPDGECGFEVPAPRQHPEESGGRREKWIYLCDDDPVQVQQLTAQLSCFGYQVTPFTRLDVLRQAVEEKPPAAVIMDVMFPEGIHAGPQVLAELNTRTGQVASSVFIASRDDFEARLQAVKAGGSAYCTKPVKANEIVEILDFLTHRTAPEPFRILVVDDEPEVARYHAMVLEEAGMVVKVATEPRQVLAMLDAFKADLVLMGMYMPDCSGPNLARVLRQMPGRISLPIIYVSSETDANRQFKALEVGADGFVTKPIEPAHTGLDGGGRRPDCGAGRAAGTVFRRNGNPDPATPAAVAVSPHRRTGGAGGRTRSPLPPDRRRPVPAAATPGGAVNAALCARAGRSGRSDGRIPGRCARFHPAARSLIFGFDPVSILQGALAGAGGGAPAA